MTSKYTTADIDDWVEMYLAGASVQEIGAKFGAAIGTVDRHMKLRGVSRTKSESRRLREAKHRAEALPDILRRMDEGQSVQAIAREIGKDRMFVNAALADAGESGRNRSDAMRQRMANASDEERKALAKAANKARRGVPASDMEMSRKAISKQRSLRYIGAGESEMIDMLTERGIACFPQFAFGRYNIDILCGPVAVEIHVSGSNPVRTPLYRKRIEYLINRGLNVLYVWSAKASLIKPSAADDIVIFLERTQSDPSFRRQYRVIRGSGKLRAADCLDDDQWSLIPMTRSAKRCR